MPQQTRLVYLDNLRVLLISLIVLLHLAITYGAIGDWYVREVPFEDLPLLPAICFIVYNATVQAFALGFFFFISGYFTAASIERKGTRKFVTGRLIRLGIPLLVYVCIVNPILIYLLHARQTSFSAFLLEHFTKGHFSTGPMWFVAALLIFSLIYILYRTWNGTGKVPEQNPASFPSVPILFSLACIIGIISFIIRLWLPVGWSMPILNFQYPYFSQYVFLFFLGIKAWRLKWFEHASQYRALPWLSLTVFMMLALPVLFMSGKSGGTDTFMGGMTWQAFSYAMWEPFVCLGSIVGLSAFFSKNLNFKERWFGILPPNAYAVYVIHPVILIALTKAFTWLSLPPLVKFLAMAPVALAGCFLAAGLLRMIPGVKRIM